MATNEAVTEASRRLDMAAKSYANAKDERTWAVLCAAAEAFSAARRDAKKPEGPAPGGDAGGSDVVAPFGRDKGKPLAKIDLRGLEWMRGVLSDSIADSSKARWLDSNQKLLTAVEAEIARR
jgi:hypothetical protein